MIHGDNEVHLEPGSEGGGKEREREGRREEGGVRRETNEEQGIDGG